LIDFQTLFEEAPNGMAVVSCDGRWLRVNRALCELVGCRENELLTREHAASLHACDLVGGPQRLRRLAAGEIGNPVLEFRHLRRDASAVWMRVSAILLRDHGANPLHVQTEDITQAKELEAELARERRRLEESQEAGRIGSWELDLETGAQRWSGEQFTIYGVDPGGRAPGLEALLALIHPDDRQSVLESMRANMESGATFTDEYRVMHPTLGTRTLVVRGRYLPRDPHGARHARLAGTTLDVTAEREAEAARWDLAEQLRLLATIVTQSDDAIVVGSPDGLITQWNDGAVRI
jgi:PAS domain S-box-containing protein